MDDKPECFDVEADWVIRSTKGVNVCFITKIPDDEIKEELKIEI